VNSPAEINSIQEFWDNLAEKVNGYLGGNWKSDHKLYYRGQANAEWPLKSSIMRVHTAKGYRKTINNVVVDEVEKYSTDGLYVFESYMIREVRKNYPSDFVGLSNFQILSKLQHHGLPTRLLDVTTNPLVAMFFACYEKSVADKDGVVFVFYSEPYLQGNDYIENAVAWSFQQRDFQPTTPSFIIDPDYDHKRIKAQLGAFIWGNSPEETSKLLIPVKFIIPSSSKGKILRQLDLMGINLHTLFPGLDNMILSVKDKYIQKYAEDITFVDAQFTVSGIAGPDNPLEINIGFGNANEHGST